MKKKGLEKKKKKSFEKARQKLKTLTHTHPHVLTDRNFNERNLLTHVVRFKMHFFGFPPFETWRFDYMMLITDGWIEGIRRGKKNYGQGKKKNLFVFGVK